MRQQIDEDMAATDPPGTVYEIYVGDYIDRGPDSAGVVDQLLGYQKLDDGVQRRFLCGNHEAGLLTFLRDPGFGPLWLQWGMEPTIQSYNIDPDMIYREGFDVVRDALDKAMPQVHKDFYHALESVIQLGDYVFVHAGIRPGVPLVEQSFDDVTFIREPFLQDRRDFGVRIVHGHTPVPEVEIHANRINIDTGAFVYGRLSCCVLEGEDAHLLQVT
jgi:serine/threonine protein phosphatase 1